MKQSHSPEVQVLSKNGTFYVIFKTVTICEQFNLDQMMSLVRVIVSQAYFQYVVCID